jgi:GT2 family glycosyltransferase
MHPGYVEAMVKALRTHPYVGGHERHDKVNAEWLQARARNDNKDGGLIRSCHRPFVAGCTIGVQRGAYEAVGGFDESLIRVKDMDFAWRLAEQGIYPTYVPEAQFYYRSRPTLWGNMTQEYNVARWFLRVHRLHGHECYVKGRPLQFLRNEAKPLIRQALKMRGWGDVLLWVRRVAWVVGLAHEAATNAHNSQSPSQTVA